MAHAARAVALQWLDRAEAAARSFRTDGGGEDLQCFRVGLGRLRATLRAYRPWLGHALPKKGRKKLRAMGKALDADGLLEAAHVWLSAQAIRSGAERTAAAEIQTRVDGMRVGSGLERWVRRFTKQGRRLRPKLLFAPVSPLDPEGSHESFGPGTGAIVRALCVELSTSLERVRCAERNRTIRRARVGAERIRTLLEPFGPGSTVCAQAVDELKRLQDGFSVLGALRLMEGWIGEARKHTVDERLAAGRLLLAWRVSRARSEVMASLHGRGAEAGCVEGVIRAADILENGALEAPRVPGGAP